MARSCGIRLGPRRYEVVVLEGNPKKHKIAAFEAGELEASPGGDLQASTAKLKEVVKRLGVPKESVGLVIDSGHAAFRRLSLPFSDEAKIGQVVKYEVESELPQWNVEEVVVDWHTLAATESSSDLLITAVPKEDIRAALDQASSAGVEPFEVELETSAMVNAAVEAELCNLDDAQLLVHIGDHSTSVVVMDSGEVREMRVIHIGALTHEAAGPSSEDAGEALGEVDPVEAGRRVDQAIQRIRRELGRSISGARTINSIDAIYVCGMELPGLIGSTVLDVPVHVLDCFEEDSGQPADGFGQLVVAYGAALRELGGGVMSPALRREELRFTGTWERIEFPLAVACLLLTALLTVIFIIQKRNLEYLEGHGARYWLASSNNFLLGSPLDNQPGYMDPPPKEIRDFTKTLFVSDGELLPTPALKEMGSIAALGRIKSMVQEQIVGLQRELGQDSAISQPQSALVGSHLVLQVLEAQQEQWRPSIWKLIAETQSAKQNKSPELVKVTMNLVFHADSVAKGVRNYEAFLAACTNIPGFQEAPIKNTNSLENDRGVEVTGQTVMVDVKEYYDRLGREANAAGGNS